MANYYPLAAGNEWTYKQKDGSTYVNKVTGVAGDNYTMHNSAANTSSVVKVDGTKISTDALEAGSFSLWLANDLNKGDTWEINFKANGLDCILIMTVKDTGISKEVEGKNYSNVLFIEAENKISMNGSILPLNFFTQYYYADGTGLILTTSSAGDIHALVNCVLH
ncbi:MAG: hypothetical protein NTW29_11455 [Bacteroidetes bacterium]|nr:hypothetical protein [Bacteroidota bacterium]